MAQISVPHPGSASTTSVVLKGRDFSNPVLSHLEMLTSQSQGLKPGRYQLPQRAIPARLKQPRVGQFQSAYATAGPCNVSYKEIIESRPPLRPDLSTPGPCTYNTHQAKPLNETNAPAYTMRPRCWPEKDRTGSRTSWSKTWYQSPEVWTTKSNFQSDQKWPTPNSYKDKRTLGGEHNPSYPRYPSYSMGHKAKITFTRRGTDKEPSPCSYDKDRADSVIYYRAPTIIHSFRPENHKLWKSESTPGPGSYTPKLNLVTRHQPAFSLGRASRDGLEPQLGPFASH